MYKTRIVSISGRTAVDVNGRQLQICSNATLFPGCSVYTDGVYIYGWNWEYTNNRKQLRKKRVVGTLPLYFYADDNNGFAMALPQSDWTLPSTYEYGHQSKFDTDTMFCWYGRPYQFHAGNNVYALRGSYSNPSLYDADGNVLNVDVSKRLYLTHDRDLGMCWQKGGLSQTFATWCATQFQKIEHDSEWDWHGGSHYKYTYYTSSYSWTYGGNNDIQCAIGNADITDLKVLYDNGGVINLNAVVQQLLADALVLLKQKQAAAVDLRGLDHADVYPTSLPDPVIVGHWLGTNVSVVDDIFNGEHKVYPVDPDSGQGGNPLVDAKSIAYNATGYRLSSDYDHDCRVVHNFRKVGNSVEFYLNLRAIYRCYGYKEMLDYDPVNEYTPAATADSWLWCAGSIDSNGQFNEYPTDGELDIWYKITITNGSASFQRIKTPWAFTQHTRAFDNDYIWTQTAQNAGYIMHKTVRLPGNWLWVRDILQLGDNKILVVGTYEDDGADLSVIALYQNDAFISYTELYGFFRQEGQGMFDGAPYNPNFNLISSIKKFKTQYEALINVPYYTLDN